jgi:nitroreductase/FMN reductase [NAD(P)H]
VGFPAARSAVSLRLPPAVVVHRDRYDDAGLEPALRDYDRRRCERQPIPPEKQKNAQVYGTTPRGTWSDQVSRQLSLPERAGFRDFLRGHGFELA